ncbi:MAG TPA: glycosyl hydrolase 108 family protein [Sphingomonas sp.]|jgi:lysozyme family protein|nr:glycosyl hydrolase 108 family protein [Sphingomonas sp.]
MDIEQAIARVIDREGGFSDHPDDRGGATRWGITEAVARAAGFSGPMRSLPRSEAVAIYRSLYWQQPGLDRIATRAPALAEELFDTGINLGVKASIGFLQRALNALNRGASDYADIAADGAIGAKTLAALDRFLARRGRGGEGVLVKAVEALQGERYLAITERRPANEAFLYGWLANRIG